MPRENLQLLADRLPANRNPLPPVATASSLATQTSHPSGYVWPDIRLHNDLTASQVLLLTAPGAMGKTIAAEALASSLQAPLIDLSNLAVGANTLTGLLTKYLGWDHAPQLINSLRDGTSCIVVDGLDEAQLRSGHEHFRAFLEDVYQLVNEGARTNQVIMLGRHDAVDTTYLILEMAGLRPSIAELQPLTKPQSHELINNTLDAQGGQIHRRHPEPFFLLCETLLSRIAEALGAPEDDPLGSWEDMADFLGSPPVLMVVANRVSVNDPNKELQDLSRPDEGRTKALLKGDLLQQIVEEILDREQRKVSANLSPQLKTGWGDKSTPILYTREEQCLRVMAHISPSLGLAVYQPEGLPPDDRATYEERISEFVPDHPFLRGRHPANVVFADYLLAFLTTSPLSSLWEPAGEGFSHHASTLGPFFVHFVHSLSRTALAGGSAAAREHGYATEVLVDHLRQSYMRGSRRGGFALYRHSGTGAALFLSDSPWEDSGSPELIFELNDPEGVVEFASPLARTMVISDECVILSSVSEEVELGPEALIYAGVLQIIGQEVVAVASSQEASRFGAILLAGEVEHSGDVRVTSHPPEALKVSWPGMWHQFARYAVDTAPFDQGIRWSAAYEMLFGLRRIFLSFEQRSGTDPAVYREKLEKQVVGASEIHRESLEGLKALGVVELVGDQYYLKRSMLGEFGVNYEAVRGPEFVNAFGPLQSELLKRERIRSLLQGG